MEFIIDGLTDCLPHPLLLFILLSAQTAITDNPLSLTLIFISSVLLLYYRLRHVNFQTVKRNKSMETTNLTQVLILYCSFLNLKSQNKFLGMIDLFNYVTNE